MKLIPDFMIGITNGWLPFVVYLICFVITLFSFPPSVRSRLYDRSLWTKKQKQYTAIGKILTLLNLILFIVSPIQFTTGIYVVGSILFCFSLAGLIIALIHYRQTPLGEPVTKGLYKISRNPQVFSIWMIFISICLMIGSYLSLLIMAVSLFFLHRSILAEESACLQQYGQSYEDYMKTVPRYFIFF